MPPILKCTLPVNISFDHVQQALYDEVNVS